MEHLLYACGQTIRIHLEHAAPLPDLFKNTTSLFRVDQDTGGTPVVIQLLIESIDRIAVPDGKIALSVALFESTLIAGRPVTNVGKKCPQHLVRVDSLHIPLLSAFVEKSHGRIVVAVMFVPEFCVRDFRSKRLSLHLQISSPDQRGGHRVTDNIHCDQVIEKRIFGARGPGRFQEGQQSFNLAGRPAVTDETAGTEMVPHLCEGLLRIALDILAVSEDLQSFGTGCRCVMYPQLIVKSCAVDNASTVQHIAGNRSEGAAGSALPADLFVFVLQKICCLRKRNILSRTQHRTYPFTQTAFNTGLFVHFRIQESFCVRLHLYAVHGAGIAAPAASAAVLFFIKSDHVLRNTSHRHIEIDCDSSCASRNARPHPCIGTVTGSSIPGPSARSGRQAFYPVPGIGSSRKRRLPENAISGNTL